MEPIALTPEVIAGVVGVLLSLIFAYFPKLNVLYAGLATEVKSLIMIGLLLATSLVIAALSHFGIIQTTEPVTWFLLVKVFVVALMTNQPTYTILPETRGVTAAKEARIVDVG